MPLDVTEIELQRTLFRFLTKSARKGEPANRDAAIMRFPTQAGEVDLDRVADGMQRRLSEMYPNAPDLRGLLQDANAEQLKEMQEFDWVAVGIYVFGLPPTKTRSGTPESSAHRELKEWAAANGAALDAPADGVGRTEYWFPSGHEADVVYVAPSATLIVEVRPRGAEPQELQRALYSLVAMRAVQAAQYQRRRQQDDSLELETARAMLVLDEEPPPEIRELALSLALELFVRSPLAAP